MSAMGHKRTFPNVQPMSALHPKADMEMSGSRVQGVTRSSLLPFHVVSGGNCIAVRFYDKVAIYFAV